MPKAKKAKQVANSPLNGDRLVLPPPPYDAITVNGVEVPVWQVDAEHMKELLGWTETEAKEGWTLKDIHGKKIALLRNTSNRSFDMALANEWKGEMLTKHWRVNGETLVVGRTGVPISLQHRGAALILAQQELESGPLQYKWQELWGGKDARITIPVLLVAGVEEDDATVNTVDTGKPRSYTDVLCRSEVFAHLPTAERLAKAKMLTYALKVFAHRTGAWLDAYSPRRTHAENDDLRARHPKLVAAVNHIYEENQRGEGMKQDPIGKFIKPLGPGSAAGLLYLMAAGRTDLDAYRTADPPSEAQVDLDNWETACEFWQELKNEGADPCKQLRKALKPTTQAEDGSTIAVELKAPEITAILIKAWQAFLAKQEVTAKDLKLDYTGEGEERTLNELPTCGGIDQGEPTKAEKADAVESSQEGEGEEPADLEETPEQVEERKEQIRQESLARKKAGKKTKVPESNPDGSIPRTNGEVHPEGTSDTVAEAGTGKPPAPKLLKKPLHKAPTQEEINAQQTAKAKADDEAMAAEQSQGGATTATEAKPKKKPLSRK